MKKTAYSLIPLLVAVSCSMAVQAQNDSSTLDPGTVRLKKEFTQHISIKGEALEKMPFANLAEALNVWLYGAYSNSTTLTYVVDGNIVPDVNAWSVYDIEEVVLVQSALTQINGNTGQQQLVLVTTRRQRTKDKFLLRVAGASAMVKTDYKHGVGAVNSDKISSYANLYHQYYVSGNYNREKMQVGVSVNWLRDVMPGIKSDTTHTGIPLHINRFRLNAWINVQVGRKSNLYLAVNATPQNAGQQIRNTFPSVVYDGGSSEKQFVVNPYLQFNTNLGKGIQNHFTASYQAFNSNDNINTGAVFVMPGQPPATLFLASMNDKVHDRLLVLRDNISTTFHARNWTIEPGIYVQYAHIKQEHSQYWTTADATNPGPNLPTISQSYAATGGKSHVFTGAPSVDFTYKNILSFGGGGFAFLPPSGTVNTKPALFPFAHFSLDVLKLHNTAAPSSLQLFASLARNYNYSFNLDALDDLTGANTSITPAITAPPVFGTGVTPMQFEAGELYKPHTVWTAGAGYRRPGDRLVVNYQYERRDFTAPAQVQLPAGTGFVTVTRYPLFQAYAHHINIMAKLVNGNLFQWQSGITATSTRVKVNISSAGTQGYLTQRESWTGGWINRVSYKHFVAGIDLLYRINEYRLVRTGFGVEGKYINSIDLQNVYAGCKIRAGKNHELEIYLNARNLLENNDSNLTDRRRYYGAGFKTVL